jgi:integrase
MIRTPGTPLVFPTPQGRQWNCSGFRDRVWDKAVAAAVANDQREPGRPSVFEGFTFHFLRHTAGSLMALAGIDPPHAAERMEHSDGGALFLRTYRHLYEAEKREQADKLDALIHRHLDSTWTDGEAGSEFPLNQADSGNGRSWDRTSDLPRVKRALSR